MDMLENIDYYSDRERAERDMALRARTAAIGKLHHEMADRYAALIRQATIQPATRFSAQD